MSEAKRVPLQTLEFPESLGHVAKKEKKGEKGKQLAPSFRFTLALPESNEETCPEFNYAQLLKAAEKKRRKETKRGEENSTNGLDPFDDDDEDALQNMAKRFEAKYGTSTADRKTRKYDDYVDLGAGYDENDSFIDNTDVYDEIVPEDMTTAHGGFYINCGALEYKSADRQSLFTTNNNNNNNSDEDESSESSDEDTEDVDSPKRTEKRMISSSEDEEPEDITADLSRKEARIDESDEKKSTTENVMKKRKKPQDQEQNSHQDSDCPMKKKEKREASDANGGTVSEDQEDRRKTEKIEGQKTKSDLDKKFDIKKFEKKTSNTNGFDGKKVDIKKLGGKDRSIDDAIESVVNAARVVDESSRDTTDSAKSRGLGSESECDDTDKEEAPIPDTLTEEDKQIVNQLKTQAENLKEGRSKFFNSTVNTLLCSLEKSMRTRNTPSDRLQTYGHLSRFLPCSKIALQNRAKKLHLQEVEYKAEEPMQRLKSIVDNVMPAVMEKYLKDCQKVANEKGFEGSPANADSSDDEEGNQNSEKSKIPRKRFPWTKETKKLIHDIANARRQYFEVLRPRKQTMQSCLLRFLETKVLPLWPQGYVDLQTLIKYSSNKPVVKKKPKKMKELANEGSNVPSGNTLPNDSGKVEIAHTNSVPTQEREKSQAAVAKVQSVDSTSNFANPGSAKSNDVHVEKKQQQQQPPPPQLPQLPQPPQPPQPQSSQPQQQQQPQPQTQLQQQQQQQQHTKPVKERCQQNENSPTSNSNSTVGKISVVPTAQLMAQKPVKNHLEKFGLMDLANSSLSITPVNDFHKSSSKISETKKDVVSITAYPEATNVLPNANEVPQTGHHSMHRQEASYSCNTQSQHSSYSASNQPSQHSKTSSLKHRILQDSTEIKTDKRLEEKELDIANKTEKREKRKDRTTDVKQKLHDAKKRKKDLKLIEPQVGGSLNAEVVPISQPQPPLSKEEQEQRQNEETIAATNFLSQIINDDVSVRAIADKRKDSTVIIEETLGGIVQPTEQEKDVQMVMRSLKELQELQEMKYSPSHSPIGSSIQKSSKSSTQYVTYQDDYQRLYPKKEDKLQPKEEPQW